MDTASAPEEPARSDQPLFFTEAFKVVSLKLVRFKVLSLRRLRIWGMDSRLEVGAGFRLRLEGILDIINALAAASWE